MILEISTTHRPATDLGYLLHKNPARAHSFGLPFGKAHVFYPVATAEECTAALLLEIDPVGLVRGGGAPGMAQEYVNDRPYVASSFLSVAIARVYGSAMAGRTADRPELVDQPLPLTARIGALPCRGGETLLRRLFEPLGYRVSAQQHHLDPALPELGASPYFSVELSTARPLRELLGHLYVLIPVLDTEKHYWIGDAEVDKLLRHGEGWLPEHPEREVITRRYLRFAPLVRRALNRLVEEDEPTFEEHEEARGSDENTLEDKVRLRDHRIGTVMAALRESGAQRVVDLGCGEGLLLRALIKESAFREILGVDVSHRALELAARRLRLDTLPPKQRERLRLLQSSLLYRDRRIEGYDAACVIEVIEHLDAARLAAFERAVFEFARPGVVIVTTPNVEYNVRFESLPAGRFRHGDHRFEWTRQQFQLWSRAIEERFHYRVRFLPVGPEDADLGAPTQMGIFARD